MTPAGGLLRVATIYTADGRWRRCAVEAPGYFHCPDGHRRHFPHGVRERLDRCHVCGLAVYLVGLPKRVVAWWEVFPDEAAEIDRAHLWFADVAALIGLVPLREAHREAGGAQRSA